MRSLFDLDSPLMNGLQKVFDCMLVSLCWLTACLPILTIGPACGALCRTVCRSICRDEGGILKPFWDTFRANLKNGVLVWLPILAVYLFLIADGVIVQGLLHSSALYGVILVLIAVTTVWAAYATAYCVRFNGSTREVLWISLFLVLAHPLTALLVMAAAAVGLVLVLMVPYLALFLPGLVCLAIRGPMEGVFRKHMRPEDLEKLEQEA